MDKEWVEHPETKVLVKYLRERVQDYQTAWLMGQYADPQDNARMQGSAQAIAAILATILGDDFV